MGSDKNRNRRAWEEVTPPKDDLTVLEESAAGTGIQV